VNFTPPQVGAALAAFARQPPDSAAGRFAAAVGGAPAARAGLERVGAGPAPPFLTLEDTSAIGLLILGPVWSGSAC
jgi:hypothetical protein